MTVLHRASPLALAGLVAMGSLAAMAGCAGPKSPAPTGLPPPDCGPISLAEDLNRTYASQDPASNWLLVGEYYGPETRVDWTHASCWVFGNRTDPILYYRLGFSGPPLDAFASTGDDRLFHPNEFPFSRRIDSGMVRPGGQYEVRVPRDFIEGGNATPGKWRYELTLGAAAEGGRMVHAWDSHPPPQRTRILEGSTARLHPWSAFALASRPGEPLRYALRAEFSSPLLAVWHFDGFEDRGQIERLDACPGTGGCVTIRPVEKHYERDGMGGILAAPALEGGSGAWNFSVTFRAGVDAPRLETHLITVASPDFDLLFP